MLIVRSCVFKKKKNAVSPIALAHITLPCYRFYNCLGASLVRRSHTSARARVVVAVAVAVVGPSQTREPVAHTGPFREYNIHHDRGRRDLTRTPACPARPWERAT